MSEEPVEPRFDPLDPRNIGAMLRTKLESLPRIPIPHRRQLGAGLYALYYVGDLPMYSSLRESGTPIYVGKAEAGNSSLGGVPDYQKPKLTNRVNKHAKSIAEVEKSGGNLSLRDFEARALFLDDAWIVLGERALLSAYRPVLWNAVARGFGSNVPGGDRKNARSFWDTIHPGRKQADSLPHRRYSYGQMTSLIDEAGRISAMTDDKQKATMLLELSAKKPPYYWFPPKKGDPDQRIKVVDFPKFIAELANLGTVLEPTRYRSISPDEAPDDLAENNDDELGTG